MKNYLFNRMRKNSFFYISDYTIIKKIESFYTEIIIVKIQEDYELLWTSQYLFMLKRRINQINFYELEINNAYFRININYKSRNKILCTFKNYQLKNITLRYVLILNKSKNVFYGNKKTKSLKLKEVNDFYILAKRIFPKFHYLIEDIEQIVSNNKNKKILVSKNRNGNINGFILFSFNDLYCFIEYIGAEKCDRGKGIGNYLLNECKSLCVKHFIIEIMLWANETEYRLRKFYEENGFSIDNENIEICYSIPRSCGNENISLDDGQHRVE